MTPYSLLSGYKDFSRDDGVSALGRLFQSDSILLDHFFGRKLTGKDRELFREQQETRDLRDPVKRQKNLGSSNVANKIRAMRSLV